MGREYEPVPGQWYENLEDEEPFRVLSVDEDEELVEIEYVGGDIAEIDYDTWREMDLEKTEQPEGWSASDDDDDDDDWDEDEEDEEEDDEDDDDDWDEDEEDDGYDDRDKY